MTRQHPDESSEQAVARRSVDAQFPSGAAFLASDDARLDAPMMHVDAPQVSEAEALAAYRTVYDEERTHVIRLLDVPGATLTVRCPDWCESDHAEDETHGTFLEDFAHHGAEEALHVDLGADAAEDVLMCEIRQHPFGRQDMRQPTVLMWPTLGMAEAQMDGAGLRRLADQLRRYAESLDDLAVDVERARDQAAAAFRADHEGRWTR